jgi:hypothetical protein
MFYVASLGIVALVLAVRAALRSVGISRPEIDSGLGVLFVVGMLVNASFWIRWMRENKNGGAVVMQLIDAVSSAYQMHVSRAVPKQVVVGLVVGFDGSRDVAINLSMVADESRRAGQVKTDDKSNEITAIFLRSST